MGNGNTNFVPSALVRDPKVFVYAAQIDLKVADLGVEHAAFGGVGFDLGPIHDDTLNNSNYYKTHRSHCDEGNNATSFEVLR